MARFLIVITGQNGILNASLELTRRLAMAGHELHLAAPRPVGERITRQGWGFTELPEIKQEPAGDGRLGEGVLAKGAGLLKRFVASGQRRRKALENTRPYAFMMLVKRWQPDLLLIDIELHEYIITAHGMERNYVLLSQWYSLWWLPGLPYLLTLTIPGVGEEGSPSMINQVWQRVAMKRQKTFRQQAQVSFGADRRSTLLRLAKENHFPLETIQNSFWPGPFSYDKLPVIAMAPLEMEFPHDPRENLHYIGPMVYANRLEQPASSHRDEPLEDILNGRRNKKIILVTVSTLSTGDTDFLQRLMLAVSGQEEWEILISLGGRLQVEDILAGNRLEEGAAGAGAEGGTKAKTDLPANVHAFSYVPQLKVLASADLSINHGGIHTIHECIYFGVPMLVYSGKRSDQPGCAARVHYHGIGLMADKDLDAPVVILEKINDVLNGPFGEKVLEMKGAIGHYAADKVLEQTVVNFLTKEPK